ncbi:reverse transcriptase domain-containing protein [Serratia proteamaculans]|uniref:reverse transcriptase domain-containing protein n=1 Tax=Serratia proteamaculans TaxID=28151 RepID=UPI0024B96389|nr:reverse transcriptase domain-containing protein [Serratia proteamaculans]
MKKFKLGLAKVLKGVCTLCVFLKVFVPFLNDAISLAEKLLSYFGIALNYLFLRRFFLMVKWESKFEIKKDRWVYVPTDEVRLYGEELHKYLRKRWVPPLYFYHLRDGGHVACAKKHLGNEYFALIDIKNFFESTGQSRVTREIKAYFKYNDARRIAKLSTVRNPLPVGPMYIIPYGFPQSPILSTLCLHKSYCGGLFKKLDSSFGIEISIYMDDIIISGNDLELCNLNYNLICDGLIRSGYEVNEKKSQAPSKSIRAFNLELKKHSLRVLSSRVVEFLMAYIKSDNPHVRKGIASYVGSVNVEQAKLFR